MAVPRVFLSSTCYDLAEVRDSLCSLIESFGFEPCLSERGDVFYHPDLHTHEACIKEISNCQLLVLMIGGRFGGEFNGDLKKSIVNAEFAAAKELNIPVFAFVKRSVLDQHRVYQSNKNNRAVTEITFPSIEKQEFAPKIFDFIDEVRHSKVNNGFFEFDHSRDIEEKLRKQWSGMFFDFLDQRRVADEYKSHNKLLSQLNDTSGQLEELVKRMYRAVDETNADSVIEEIERRHAAERFFSDLLENYSLPGFMRTPIDTLVRLPTNVSWYEWCASTDDFTVDSNCRSANGDRIVDLLSDTNLGIGMAIGGDLDSDDQATNAKLRVGFSAFASLPIEQKRIVLEPMTGAAAYGFHDESESYRPE